MNYLGWCYADIVLLAITPPSSKGCRGTDNKLENQCHPKSARKMLRKEWNAHCEFVSYPSVIMRDASIPL